MQRFRGGLEFQAHRLCVSLNSRLESNQEEKKKGEVWRKEVVVSHEGEIGARAGFHSRGGLVDWAGNMLRGCDLAWWGSYTVETRLGR